MNKLYLNATDPVWGFAFDGATDDSAAMSAFLNAAASSGSPAMLPPGTTRIASVLPAINVAKQLKIVGAGRPLAGPVVSPDAGGGNSLLYNF